MSEWIVKLLGQLVSFQKGRKVETSEYPLQGFAPYLGASAISGVIEEYGNTRNGVMAVPNDVLMLWDGERSGLVGKSQAGVISSTVARLSPKDDIESSFLYYSLDSKFEWIQGRRTGTGIPHVPKDLGRILQISYPKDKNQQYRITEILSTVDETIEQTEALIAKYQQIKAGMMHDLFTRGVTPDGKLRPTYQQAPNLYRESSLGWRIPKEWDVKPLGDMLAQCGGYLQTGPFGSQLHAYEYQIEGVPVVMPQNINDGLISTEGIALINEARAHELARHRMRIGDIIIARRGDLSRAAAITESEQGWICGTGCFLLRVGQSKLRSDFIAYSYRQDFIQRQIAARAVGSTMPSLNNSVMTKLLFLLCDEDEQKRIVDRLDVIEQSLLALRENLSINRVLKNGLMHDLLTGRVQVNVPEHEEV